MAVKTRLAPYALPGRLYGSFADKTVIAIPTLVPTVEEVVPPAVWRAPPRKRELYLDTFRIILQPLVMTVWDRLEPRLKQVSVTLPVISLGLTDRVIRPVSMLTPVLYWSIEDWLRGWAAIRFDPRLTVGMTIGDQYVLGVYHRVRILADDLMLGIDA